MADPAYDPAVCSRPFTTDRADPINNNPACHTEISRAERFALGLTDPLDVAARPRWPLDELAAPMIGSGQKGAKA